MMGSKINRQIVVVELPQGKLEPRHFQLREAAMPELADGQVLTRTVYLSLDAANRAWMQGATYKAPVLAGDVMHGGAISVVEASSDPKFKAGDVVECMPGWQDYAALPGKTLNKIESKDVQAGSLHHGGTPMTLHMSVLGITGLTAYFGLLEVGQPKRGETLVVSAAAGAVGNVVGQIGKIKGMRVVGIAGSNEKCKWLTKELGFDAAINYKSGPVSKGLKENCPNGIDVYFDNTGGEILEAVLFQMNMHGRIACCGVVSQYDTANPASGPRGVPGLLVVKRLKMEGFIVMDYFAKRAQATAELAGWVKDGRLKVKEDIVEGLENAPKGLIGLLHGENSGKRLVRVSPEPK